MVFYNVHRFDETFYPQFSFGYGGATRLAGLELTLFIDPLIFYAPEGTTNALPVIRRELLHRLEIDADLPDLTPAQAKTRLLLSHYRERPASADSMIFAVTSSDESIMLPSLEHDTLSLTPVAAGTVDLVITSNTYVDSLLFSSLVDSMEVVVHDADTESYNIRLIDLHNDWMHVADRRARLELAVTRWSLVLADRPQQLFKLSNEEAVKCGHRADFFFPVPNDLRGFVQLPVDDHVVFINMSNIDGPKGITAVATICALSTDSIPSMGRINFDPADLDRANRPEESKLGTTVHEMVHTMGMASHPGNMRYTNRLRFKDRAKYWPHANAVTEFNTAMDGVAYPFDEEVIVPLESGSAHMNEEIMGDEFMTPRSGSTAVFSAITVGVLADFGYVLKSDWRDHVDDYILPYARPAMDMAGAVADDGSDPIDLSNDVIIGPIYVVDNEGNVIEVIPPPRE